MNIYPIGDGIVYCVSCKGSAFGNHVVIKHSNGFYSLYAHMRSTPRVRENQKVYIDTKLGNVGSTGNVTGPHLHLELWKGVPWSGNNDVNPANYIDSSASGPGRCYVKTSLSKGNSEEKVKVNYSYSCTNTARVRAIEIKTDDAHKVVYNKLFSKSGKGSFNSIRKEKDRFYRVIIKYYDNPRTGFNKKQDSSEEKIKSYTSCKFEHFNINNGKINYKLNCSKNVKINKIVYKMGSEVFTAPIKAFEGTIETEETNTSRYTYLVAYYNENKKVKSQTILSNKTSNFNHVNKESTFCDIKTLNTTDSLLKVNVVCQKNATPIKVSLQNVERTKELKIYRNGIFEKPIYGYNGDFIFNNLNKNTYYYARVVYRFKDEDKTKLDAKYIKFKTLN